MTKELAIRIIGAKMDAPTQKSVDNALEALDEVEE